MKSTHHLLLNFIREKSFLFRLLYGRQPDTIFWSSFFIYFMALMLFSTLLMAQVPSQTLRGKILDQQSKAPIPGAHVVIIDTEPVIGDVSDSDGNFKIQGLAVGRYNIQVMSMGYEVKLIPDVLIGAGKEVVLSVDLLESLIELEELEINSNMYREQPLNDMSLVSARSFSVEETKRYAASVNDPSRMAMSFAGVSNNDDANGEIIIRGNSPRGLLWKVEGVEVPNPNHFGEEGASGGGISILSVNMLTNSDFLTGAFAAEYGNAYSGVFDIRLRKGNNERKEYAFQAGVIGIDFAAEGPFAEGGKSSYLVNYRYSTLSLLDKIGIKGFEGYIPEFQDLSFKLHFPTRKAGTFSIWSLSGLSSQSSQVTQDSSFWENRYDRYQDNFMTNMTANGITHNIFLNKNTYLESILSISGNEEIYKSDSLDNNYIAWERSSNNYSNLYMRASTTLNAKLSSRLTLRSGLIGSRIAFNMQGKYWDEDKGEFETYADSQGATFLYQGYLQGMYRFNQKLTLNGGLHTMHLALNKNMTIEPRLGLQWQISPNSTISAGYGLHSRIESMVNYFSELHLDDGRVIMPNKNLDFLRASHYVLGYSRKISQDLHFKAEAYYQQLNNVAIGTPDNKDPYWQSFSSINFESGFIDNDSLLAEGTGRNYGLEFTLEKFFTNNYYFLITSSFYESKYTARDGIERDTRFNGNFVSNVLAGKEFKTGENDKNLWSINLRGIYAGGRRDTPIDLETSAAKERTEYDYSKRYSFRNENYLRVDLRIAYTVNNKHTSSTISLDVQNVTNRQNVFGRYYNSDNDQIEYAYQMGILPVLNYRLEF